MRVLASEGEEGGEGNTVKGRIDVRLLDGNVGVLVAVASRRRRRGELK